MLAEGEELGSNLLHAGQRSPAYPSEAERMAETAELGSNNLSHDLARVGTCARRSARSVAIRTASMLFGQHQSFARQRWTLPAAP